MQAFIKLKLWRATWLFALMLGTVPVAHAGIQTRPVIGGYHNSVYFYPDPDEMGREIACSPGTGVFDHVEYIPSSLPHPDVYLWCRYNNSSTLYKANQGTAWVWLNNCADSTSGTGYNQTTSFTCPSTNDKPPPGCNCDNNTTSNNSTGSGTAGNNTPDNRVGNPVSLAEKEKSQTETDYVAADGLAFVRYYSSLKLPRALNSLPQGWRHNYSKQLISTQSAGNTSASSCTFAFYQITLRGMSPYYCGATQSGQVFAYITRPDGYSLYFVTSNAGVSWQTDSDVNYQLISGAFDSSGKVTQWQLVTPKKDTETYDQDGKLVSIQFRNGQSQTLTYSTSSTSTTIAPQPGLLIQVSNNFGRSLYFQYDSTSRLTQMTDAAGQVYTYAYDSNDNLTSITYPDGLKRTYLYNEVAYSPTTNPLIKHILTGIADEISTGNVVRYATFTYDSLLKPLSTEHAGGVDKYVLNHSSNVITDPLGTNRTYTYSKVNGVNLQTKVTQPAGSGSAASSVNLTYDANGNVSSYLDYNSNKTCYGYDTTRNLETARVEGLISSTTCSTILTAGSLTAPARKISTQWHSTYRLPLQIAEAKKLTTFTYDTAGNLLTKTEQATTDTSGVQAFTATTTGTARTWTYTYNSVGQVLTVDGPRTDVTDVTTYTYDTSGNLTSITDAAGNVTTLSSYDANGKAGHIVAPDGKATNLTYDTRGRLTQMAVTDGTLTQTTGYAYDGANELTSVTLPDGGTLTYTYDAAHRLTDITDNLGNTVHYVLDNMGNRTTEQVKDPGGTLTRQITRVYDAINRLQTITGGVQ